MKNPDQFAASNRATAEVILSTPAKHGRDGELPDWTPRATETSSTERQNYWQRMRALPSPREQTARKAG